MYTIDFDLWNQIYYTMGDCITGKTSDFNNKQQYILMRSDIVVARLFLGETKTSTVLWCRCQRMYMRFKETTGKQLNYVSAKTLIAGKQN